MAGQLSAPFPAGTITAQPPGTLGPNPMDALADNQLGGEQVEEAPELPPPTELFVDQPPGTPVPVTVETHRMSLQWTPVSVTVKSNEICVVEYLLEYKLEMQQLEGNSGSADPVPLIEDGCWWTQYQGTATYVQVNGLRPGRRYAVRVACQPVVTDDTVVVHLAAPSPVLLVDTPATPPDTPGAPVLASKARNTLKFKWREPEETGGRAILYYVLEMVPPPMGWEGAPNGEGWYTIYTGPERSCMVKRLQPGVRYAARIKCANSLGESPYSQPFSTCTQASVPSPPAMPLVVAASESSVILQWEAPPDNGAEITGYQLEMDDGRGNGFMLLNHGPATSHVATGLQSGVVYKFRVRAENEAGRSVWSPVCEALTAATIPSPPSPPTMLGSNQSSVSTTWKEPDFDGGSPVVGYEVEVQPKCKAAKKGMFDDWLLMYQGGDKACSLGGLRAGCTYRVRVRAFNTRGPGNYSMPADVSTAPDVPEAPVALAASTRQQTVIVLGWGKPEHDGGSPITAYRLEMCHTGRLEELGAGGSSDGKCKAKLEPHFEAAYVGPETSAEVSGLEPGCRYQFQVLAINKQGASGWSQPVMVDTRPGLPFPPIPPEVNSATATSLQLSWAPSYGQGAPVTAYVLQLCRLQALQQAQQAVRLAATQQQQQQQVAGEGHPDAEQQQQQAAAVSLPPGLPIPGGDVQHAVANTAAAQLLPDGVEHPDGHAAPSSEADGASSPALPDMADAIFQTAYHGSDLSCTVRELEPDTEYAFRLRACNSVGASTWSAVEHTKTASAPPSAPLELTAVETTSSSVHVSWQQPEADHGSPVTGYQLEYAAVVRASRAQPHWRVAYHGLVRHCMVDKLSPGREYQLRVRAGNACGWGPWVEPTHFTTEPDVPEAPEPPTFSNRMGTSVRIKWQAPLEDNGAAVGEFVLEMAPAGGSFQAVYAGESTSYRAQQLAPGTQYQFRVRAGNAVGLGPYSEASSVCTTSAPPSPPTWVEAVLADSDAAAAPAVLVSWEPAPQGELQAACISYEIDAVPVPAGDASAHGHKSAGAAVEPKRQTCSAKVPQHTLTGLQPGATYTVRVRGIGADGAGHGDWSDAATVQLPAVEKPAAGGAMAHAGSGDEEADAVRARRKKGKGGGAGDAPRAPRGQTLGAKTVVAKGIPKRTILTPVAAFIRIPERQLWKWVNLCGKAICGVLVIFVILFLYLGK